MTVRANDMTESTETISAEQRKRTVLILCTGNSARSQMAEGLLRHICQDACVVHSAGTHPSTVRPEAIAALAEIGIDITSHRSKSVDEFTDVKIDHVLTVCDSAAENCPIFPAEVARVHHSFDDPAAVEGDHQVRMAAFRRVRDEIKEYLERYFIPQVVPPDRTS